MVDNMWSYGRWFVAMWSLSACTSGAVWGTADNAASTARTAESASANGVLAHNEPLALLGPQRRWLVDVHVTVRWARELVDTLAAWWRTDTLRELQHGLDTVDTEIDRFGQRHQAPRLSASWSPVHDADSPLARRYDEIMLLATANRTAAEQQARMVLEMVITVLNRGDVAHPEIALRVSTLVEHLTA
jgi:hypothetical protein